MPVVKPTKDGQNWVIELPDGRRLPFTIENVKKAMDDKADDITEYPYIPYNQLFPAPHSELVEQLQKLNDNLALIIRIFGKKKRR